MAMKYEPSSDTRQTAISLRRLYEAMADVGFTDQQAFVLVLEAWRVLVRDIITDQEG